MQSTCAMYVHVHMYCNEHTKPASVQRSSAFGGFRYQFIDMHVAIDRLPVCIVHRSPIDSVDLRIDLSVVLRLHYMSNGTRQYWEVRRECTVINANVAFHNYYRPNQHIRILLILFQSN